MATRALQVSFGSGEVTPEFFGRIDDPKFKSGAETVQNFITLPHGPASNRPGFAFVSEVKTSSKKTRLIPFSYSITQTMALQFGDGYIRFHTLGGNLLYSAPTAWNSGTAYTQGDLCSYSGTNYYCILGHTNNVPPNATYWYPMPSSTVYEIPTNYAEADLFELHYVQSADVLTICHQNYPPAELKRIGTDKWTLTPISFVSSLSAPTGVTATPTGTGSYSYAYKVTAVASGGLDESPVSSAGTCSNNLYTTGNYNTISWTTVSGAQTYRVYKQSNGSGFFGYIGQTDGLTFRDDNIAADVGNTPPIANAPFSGSGNYPGAVSYFEQRRCFAGTLNKPQNIWMTRTGTESNLNYCLPTKDDDSIGFRVAAREANTIRHIVPLNNMVLLTGAAEWRVTSVNTDAITPTSISVRPQSYIGAGNAQPVIVNNNLIYASARGGHVREQAYSWQANGYITGDLSLRAPHLFDGLDITDIAYMKSPFPVCWFVSTSGKLLGLTYVPEQQVGGWHQHVTDGIFESVCVVAEGGEDAVYVVVKRTIGGSTKRYVERMASRMFSDQADAFFVDSGLTYSGSPATVISGLGHLEGKVVNILADGAVHPQRTVTSGSITLDQAASKVHVGLPITADLKTLPLAMQIDNSFGQGHQKNVNKVWVRVYRSSGIFAGPSDTQLVEAKQRSEENYGTAPALKSGEIPIMIKGQWGDGGQVLIRQTAPLPLTILSVTMEVAIGG